MTARNENKILVPSRITVTKRWAVTGDLGIAWLATDPLDGDAQGTT